jgi:hypothetical protein
LTHRYVAQRIREACPMSIPAATTASNAVPEGPYPRPWTNSAQPASLLLSPAQARTSSGNSHVGQDDSRYPFPPANRRERCRRVRHRRERCRRVGAWRCPVRQTTPTMPS